MAELTEVKGVSDSRAEDLREAGFTTVDDIATATAADLSEVSGIGSSTAEGLIDSAQDVIRGDTLSESETEQTQESAEEDDDEYEVTEEDLRDLVEEQPDGEPSIDDANTDDDTDTETVTVDPQPPFDVTLTVESEEQYDYLYYSMVSLHLGNVYVNGPQQELANDILDQMRTLDGAGDVTLSLYKDELNALHAALQKMESSVQGLLNNKPYNAIKSLRSQVNEARDEYIR